MFSKNECATPDAVEYTDVNTVETVSLSGVEPVALRVVEPVTLHVVEAAALNDVATAALSAVEPTAVSAVKTSVSGGQNMDSETNGTTVAACNPMGDVSLGAAVERCVGCTSEPSDVVLVQQVLEVAELAIHHAVNECGCGAYVDILPVVDSLEAGVQDVDSLCEMVQVLHEVEQKCQCKCALKALDVVQIAIQHCVHKLMDADAMEQPNMEAAAAVYDAMEQPNVKAAAAVYDAMEQPNMKAAATVYDAMEQPNVKVAAAVYDAMRQSAVKQAATEVNEKSATTDEHDMAAAMAGDECGIRAAMTAVCEMPISEPAVFETLVSEPARDELLVSELAKGVGLTEVPVCEPVEPPVSADGRQQSAVKELEAAADEKQLSAMNQAATDDEAAAMMAAVLSMFNGIETAMTSLEEKMESVELQCGQQGQQCEQRQSIGYGEQQSIGYGQQQVIGHGYEQQQSFGYGQQQPFGYEQQQSFGYEQQQPFSYGQQQSWL